MCAAVKQLPQQVTIVFAKNWNAIHERNPDGSRKYRYIINKGSSRSSKTYSLIDVMDAYGRENENKRLTSWRDTKKDCRDTVGQDALKRLKTTGRYKLDQEFNKTEFVFTYLKPSDPNQERASRWEINGTDDEEKVHGLTQDAAWLNEPYKISRDTFDQIDQRTSDFVIIDLNPKKGHWVDDLELDPRAIVIHSTFLDNPFCPSEQRIKILGYQPVKWSAVVLKKLIDEDEARVYDCSENRLAFTEKQINELSRCQLNEFKKSANAFNWVVYGLGLKAERPHRIYHFEECADHVFEQIKATIFYAVDWGKVDPWAILAVKYYDGVLYCKEINYASENDIRANLSATERSLVAGVERNSDDAETGKEQGLVTWYFNKFNIPRESVIVCDPNRTLKIRGLRKIGYDYAIAAQKPAGSIVDGISIVSNLNVVYTASSKNFKYEQENYSNKVVNGVVQEEPEDIDNHLMDALRYVVDYLIREEVITII